MGISKNTFITSVSTSTPLHNQDQEDQEQGGHLRNFDLTAMIKTPPLLDEGNNNNNKHEINEITEDNDGFKTPTGIEYKIKVNLSCPPPAPTRPRAKPMKRRRSDLVRTTRTLKYLDHVSDDDADIRKLNNIRSFR